MLNFYLISQDSTTAIQADNSYSTWVIENDVYLAVQGIAVNGNYSAATNRMVRVDGHILSSGTGIFLGKDSDEGGLSVVEIGKNGSIDAWGWGTSGMHLLGGNLSVFNQGSVTADGAALLLSGARSSVINSGIISSKSDTGIVLIGDLGSLENSGTILGSSGVHAVGDFISIINSGTISGKEGYFDSAAVKFEYGNCYLENTGTISQTFGTAILGSAGSDTISNRGSVSGDVNLGDGADIFENIGGIVSGAIDLGAGDDSYLASGGSAAFVDGGEGNDTYFIDSSLAMITEAYQYGTDWVVSSVSYTLAANFEGLALSGDEDLRGAGNRLDNMILGNGGDNRLLGGRGNDVIDGAGGADIIRGGRGNDTVEYLSSDDGVVANLFGGVGEGGDAEGDVLYKIENLYGSGYDDVLKGNSGANILFGGWGGNDTLRGNGGADNFAFGIFQSPQGNHDIIADFVNDLDIIVMGGDVADFDTAAEVIAAASQQGANVVFNFGANDSLTLLNFSMANLDASDFSFNWVETGLWS